jgi:hypothetical protein
MANLNPATYWMARRPRMRISNTVLCNISRWKNGDLSKEFNDGIVA